MKEPSVATRENTTAPNWQIWRIFAEVIVLIGLLLLFNWNQEAILPTWVSLWIRQTFHLHNIANHSAMMLLTLAFLPLGGKSIRSCGLDFRNLADHSKRGFNLFPLFLLPMVPSTWTGIATWYGALVIVLGYALCFWPMARMLQKDRFRWRTGLRRLAAVTATGFIYFWLFHIPAPALRKVPLPLLYYFLFVGFGEEFMFRGYIQTRFNDALGKPYSLFGTQFGLGLVITSLIFGSLHTLNAGFNPFHHVFRLVPWWGVWTAASGFFLGFVREKADSVIPGSIVHGLGASVQVFFTV